MCKDLEKEEKSRGKKLPVFFCKDETPMKVEKRNEKRDYRKDSKLEKKKHNIEINKTEEIDKSGMSKKNSNELKDKETKNKEKN